MIEKRLSCCIGENLQVFDIHKFIPDKCATFELFLSITPMNMSDCKCQNTNYKIILDFESLP